MHRAVQCVTSDRGMHPTEVALVVLILSRLMEGASGHNDLSNTCSGVERTNQKTFPRHSVESTNRTLFSTVLHDWRGQSNQVTLSTPRRGANQTDSCAPRRGEETWKTCIIDS